MLAALWSNNIHMHAHTQPLVGCADGPSNIPSEKV